MRVNITGVGRFTISLYGEIKRGTQRGKLKNEFLYVNREKIIVEDYVQGLKQLADLYDDEHLIDFVNDFQTSNMYIEAFDKSVKLARLRKVPEDKLLDSKTTIDTYFQGGSAK